MTSSDEQQTDTEIATTQPDTEPTARRPHRIRRATAALAVAAVAVGGISGFTIARGFQSGSAGTTATAVTAPTNAGSATAKLTLAQIEATVDPALVDVTATLGTSGKAEGTGMVISSTGEVLTNNHVISGATAISVQIGGTGATYAATVVGYDVGDDVAVLQLTGASGLTTIETASASTVSVDDAVVAIGNALGAGGTPTPASGVVTALEQTITASDGYGTSAETLNGLIEFAAAVQPGDSGGAVVDAYGRVVGMTTAASSDPRQMSTAATATTTTAFAIPIDDSLAIARAIEAGSATATIHVGDTISVGWQNSAGQSHTARVTLTTGAA